METLNSSNIPSRMAALDLSTVGLLIVGLLTVYVTHWIYRWRNPKCNGVLPPGSMGLPLIGETIQLVIPSASLDLPPFIKKRMKREKLLPQMEDMVIKTLLNWSSQESVEVKSASVTMAIDYAARQIYSGNLENAPLKISDLFRDLVDGLMTFPINIPGTAHHRCLQTHKKVREMMKDIVKTRLVEPERQYGDMLDHMIEDMKKETFLNEDFILLAEHPLVLEELTAEHEEILQKREKSESHLTWNDYKSMTFTLQVINEVLRLGNIAPGFFRRALQDIPVNGYTIPAGWVIMIATAGLHLNSNQFEDPLKFNPWRWKELQPSVIAKCFMPFGSGMKQCAGAEYSRVLLATFLHVLVTKYRWAIVKGGKIIRSPIMRFPDGFHYKITEKTN
ncbi:unnamed protein product [Fraxinus pennsylvanica]|uniref:Cytochrome P450 n=1 Tax=Fraxinus pennsylvanica TaxID=56036 RepID=A0AAD1ZEM7_9LAMI|nr:unnamed protein product [Fraxinus pennsylvanica]